MIPKYKPPPRNLRESRLARFQAALEGLEPDEAEHLALLRDAIVSVQKREHPMRHRDHGDLKGVMR